MKICNIDKSRELLQLLAEYESTARALASLQENIERSTHHQYVSRVSYAEYSYVTQMPMGVRVSKSTGDAMIRRLVELVSQDITGIKRQLEEL